MSEDKKKNLRTQGKYSDISKNKSCDRRQRVSPADKEPNEKKYNRCSNGSKGASNSFAEEDVPRVRYEENADHSFHQLDEPIPPTEIYTPGLQVLSTTNNGDSKIFYEPCFLEDNEALEYFEDLYQNINWYSKNIIINGEEKQQPRMVAWFGPYPYSYSGATLEPAEMPNSVLEIKWLVEENLKENGINATFNSVLLNLYRDNRDSVAWHSDDEITMGICPTIASVSLGETRKFEFRRKKKYMEYESPTEVQAQYFVYLMNGSLIVMDGCMQDDWQHRIPKEYHDKEARINLTFRTVYPLKKSSHNRSSERADWRKDVDTLNSNKASSCNIHLDEEAFPPLNSNRRVSFSGKRSNIHETSNSSLESDALNKSDDIWESESSVVESVTGDLNSDNSYNSSFETNSSKFHLDDSVESSPRKSLNVSAKEFVPNFTPKYGRMSLRELIRCKVNFLHDRTLMDFAFYLKSRVEEKLHEFPNADKDELEFMCLLTDGTQTEKNQKIITSRMIKVVSNNLERHQKSTYVEKTNDRSHGYEKRSNNMSRRNNSYQKKVTDCKVQRKTSREWYKKNINSSLKYKSPATNKSNYDDNLIQLLEDNSKERQNISCFKEVIAIPEVKTENVSSPHAASMSPIINNDNGETTDHRDGMEPPRKKRCYSHKIVKVENSLDEHSEMTKDLQPQKQTGDQVSTK